MNYIAKESSARARSVSVLQNREAVAFLAPVISQIPSWQVSITRLIGIAERSRVHGTDEEAAMAEAITVEQAVTRVRADLTQHLHQAPLAFAGNGRVQDCLNALDSVAIGISRARSLLDQSRQR